jgi:spore coat protein A, manganese oxidase
MERRRLLQLSGLAGAGIVLPANTALAPDSTPAAPVPFAVPLRIPPVLTPMASTPSADYYSIKIRETTAEIFPGLRTPVLTYGGSFPGPTIKVRRNRRAVVTHRNALGMPVTVHLHGGHVPAGSDGHPSEEIAPGGKRSYDYPNAQRGATLWYHDHTHHMEGEHVFRGLSGLYLLEDPAERRLRLPAGRYDVPLILRDARFDENGAFVYEMNDFAGRTTLLVNGRVQPYLKVAGRKYRLRLVNGSNDRAFRLQLRGGGDLVQIASDGGLLAEPVAAPFVDLWPGERAEVVVDFARYEAGTGVVLENAFGETPSTREVMRFDVGRRRIDDSRVPDVLAEIPPVVEPAGAVVRDVVLNLDLASGHFLINGKPFDPDRVDFTIKEGSTEIWRITNTDTAFTIPHNLHLHLVQFRVLDRDGQPPAPAERGWKDTVTVMPGSTVRVVATFAGYTGRYLYHCHLLDHGSMSMMATMEIVR